MCRYGVEKIACTDKLLMLAFMSAGSFHIMSHGSCNDINSVLWSTKFVMAIFPVCHNGSQKSF